MNTTIVYRDMIAANPRTCVDELDHVYPTMRCSIRASIADGARKGVTAQMSTSVPSTAAHLPRSERTSDARTQRPTVRARTRTRP